MSVKLSVLLVILLGFIAYSNCLRNEFVWDDASSVQFNKHITSPTYISEIFKSEFHHFSRGQGNFYRPVLTLSFMMDYKLWKLKPFGYHLTNALMHIGVALLVFVLVKAIFGKVTVALAASLLFVVHPIQTQAVTYVSGRGDMLANLFLLSSFLLYWRVSAGTGNNPSGERRSHDVLCVTGAILCYVAALLSKETAIVLPFLVLACALVFRERRNRTASIILVVCLFCCMLVYAVLRETCLKFGVSTTAPLPLGTRLLNACQAFATYVRLLLVPVGLHMERTIDEVAPAAVIFTIAVLAAACIYVWKRWRESPGTAFALLWFVIAWLPISGIYPLNAAIAEHWLYLPSIGFLAFVVGSFDRILTSEQRLFPPKLARTLSIGSLAIILLCFTTLTIRRNGDWRDNFTLYTKTLEKAPNSSRVHYNLAIVYEQRGEDEKALGEFLETLRLDPDNAYVRLDLAAICARKGEQEEAARLYMEAIRRNPNDPEMVEAYVNLAGIYHQRGQREESTKLMQKAYQVNPEAMRRWFPQVGQP